MDSKKKVLDALEILRIRDLQSGEKFSALAYTKAIRELKKLESIKTVSDVENIAGVGKKIKEKVKEILETGELKAAEKAKEELSIDVYQDLLKIQGVGPVKAKDLIEKHKIKSIEELRSKPELLNDVQIMGLKYYEDSLERIPRDEMMEHEKKIMEKIQLPFQATIVGSYRRGAESSGDIDVLIKAPENLKKKETKEAFEALVKKYQTENYLVDILALANVIVPVTPPPETQLKFPAPSVLNICPLIPPLIFTLPTGPNETLLALVKLTVPVLVTPVNVPTLVIFACAALVTDSA